MKNVQFQYCYFLKSPQNLTERYWCSTYNHGQIHSQMLHRMRVKFGIPKHFSRNKLVHTAYPFLMLKVFLCPPCL